jgi:signal transduction histidine kinase
MRSSVIQAYFFLLLLLPQLGLAQQSIWKIIGSEQEFPSPTVLQFKRLPDGRMAMATPEGLVLFDGYTYQKIQAKPIATELVNPYITHLVLAPNGMLWLATRNSIWKFNSTTNSLKVFIDTALNLGGVKQLELSSDSLKVYALFNHGLWSFNCKDTGTIYPIQKITTYQYPNQFHKSNALNEWVFYYHQEGFRAYGNNNLLWELKDKNIIDAQYDYANKVWLILKSDGAYWLKDRTLCKLPFLASFHSIDKSDKIFSDGLGSVWISSSKELLEYSSLSDSFPTIHRSDKVDPYTLRYHSATAGLKEQNGNIWIGGSAGSFGFTNRKGEGVLHLSSRSLGVGFIWTFFREEDKIFFGSSEGIVIGKVKDGFVEKVAILNPKPGERFVVSGISKLDENSYLIGTFNKGFWKLSKKDLQLSPFTLKYPIGNCLGIQDLPTNSILIQGAKGLVIFRRADKKIIQFKSGPNINNPISAYLDRSGNYWIGSGMGFSIVDSNRNTIKTYEHHFGDSGSLSGNIILCFKEASNGQMFIGTMGGGFCCFDKRTQKFSTIKLPGNPINIYGIMEVDSLHLILTSSNGIILYNLKNKFASALNKKNVLPFNDFGQLAYYSDHDYYYAGGETGAILIPKENCLLQFSSSFPLVFRQNGLIQNSIVQAANNRNISLEIGPKDAVYLGEIQYRFRLNGFEEEWHYLPKNQNKIVYNYLPSGKYELEAQLIDENNYYHAKPIRIQIEIMPFYYETIWFKISASILLVGILFLVIRYFSFLRLKWKLKKLEEEQRLSNERIRISRELHDNVGSQLSYLISGLEASELYLQRENGEKLAQNISEMQDSARESMQQLRDAIWALNRDKMSCENMAEQFSKWYYRVCSPHKQVQAKFESSFEQNVFLDPVIGLNVFRMMQEAVNNALKHAEASEIRVHFMQFNNQLQIVIIDNGKGFTLTNGGGYGMETMQSRAKESGAKIEIQTELGKGCKIVIQLPINTPIG